MALLLLANMINLGADLGAMAARELLVGGPPASMSWCSRSAAPGSTYFQYPRYVSVFKWGSFCCSLTWRPPSRSTCPGARSLAAPSCQISSPNKDDVVTVVAVMGTTITPYCFFWQASQEAEDQRVDPTADALLDRPPRRRRRSRGSVWTPMLGWATRT